MEIQGIPSIRDFRMRGSQSFPDSVSVTNFVIFFSFNLQAIDIHLLLLPPFLNTERNILGAK